MIFLEYKPVIETAMPHSATMLSFALLQLLALLTTIGAIKLMDMKASSFPMKLYYFDFPGKVNSETK